jgi:hypothetical protein
MVLVEPTLNLGIQGTHIQAGKGSFWWRIDNGSREGLGANRQMIPWEANRDRQIQIEAS